MTCVPCILRSRPSPGLWPGSPSVSSPPAGTPVDPGPSQITLTMTGYRRVAPGVSREAAGNHLVSAGAPPGTRTPNPQIKSLLLCQLS